MRVRVLGAAAGGGFPQWNANSESCRRARAGDEAAPAATQASIALSADGARWVLVNASPDLRQQIEHNACLHPSAGLRSSPIAAVVLTNADVDAVAGLLHLREGTPFALYAHQRVHRVLDRNPIFEVVNRDLVPRRTLDVEGAIALKDAAGEALGIDVVPFLAPGKLPLYLEGRCRSADRHGGDGRRHAGPRHRGWLAGGWSISPTALASPTRCWSGWRARTCCFSTGPCGGTTR